MKNNLPLSTNLPLSAMCFQNPFSVSDGGMKDKVPPGLVSVQHMNRGDSQSQQTPSLSTRMQTRDTWDAVSCCMLPYNTNNEVQKSKDEASKQTYLRNSLQKHWICNIPGLTGIRFCHCSQLSWKRVF